MTAEPTIFNFTHWKAGSTWIDAILRRAVPEKVVQAKPESAHIRKEPLIEGMIYTRAYLTCEEFEKLDAPAGSTRFVVIRDIRDMIVSAYFSQRFSHDTANFPRLARSRERLSKGSFREGLEWAVNCQMTAASAEIQRSWLATDIEVIRYEDLLENDAEILPRVLIEDCGLTVEPRKLQAAIRRSRFAAETGGRERGQENHLAHQRNGVPGDWRAYLRGDIKGAVKDRFGELLVTTGYEKDLDW